MTSMNPHSCFICAHPLARFGNRAGFTYFRCVNCKTIQLSPLPKAKELAALYSENYARAGHHENPSTNQVLKKSLWDGLASTLLRHCSGGRVLDYGSGWGDFCEMMGAHPQFACEGVDHSQEMVAYSNQRGVKATHGDLDSFPDNSFDAIVMCTVFEHLVDHDSWIEAAKSKLKPDGTLISLQPTSEFPALLGRMLKRGEELPDLNGAFTAPWHTGLISCSGMISLFERHGFTTAEVRPAPNTRRTGLIGLGLRALEPLNHIAYRLFGDKWPLAICHVFVFKRTP